MEVIHQTPSPCPLPLREMVLSPSGKSPHAAKRLNIMQSEQICAARPQAASQFHNEYTLRFIHAKIGLNRLTPGLDCGGKCYG